MILLTGVHTDGNGEVAYEVTGMDAVRIAQVLGDPVRPSVVIYVTISHPDLTDEDRQHNIYADSADAKQDDLPF